MYYFYFWILVANMIYKHNDFFIFNLIFEKSDIFEWMFRPTVKLIFTLLKLLVFLFQSNSSIKILNVLQLWPNKRICWQLFVLQYNYMHYSYYEEIFLNKIFNLFLYLFYYIQFDCKKLCQSYYIKIKVFISK